MRQMVLGAIAAFALTVIVISFLSPKANQPSVTPDAGFDAGVIAPQAIAPPRAHLLLKPPGFVLQPPTGDSLRVSNGVTPQLHGIVTDAGK
ncbi:MAG: hypothetical protein ACJ790_11795 [Myxococcaceae bacterium]